MLSLRACVRACVCVCVSTCSINKSRSVGACKGRRRSWPLPCRASFCGASPRARRASLRWDLGGARCGGFCPAKASSCQTELSFCTFSLVAFLFKSTFRRHLSLARGVPNKRHTFWVAPSQYCFLEASKGDYVLSFEEVRPQKGPPFWPPTPIPIWYPQGSNLMAAPRMETKEHVSCVISMLFAGCVLLFRH